MLTPKGLWYPDVNDSVNPALDIHQLATSIDDRLPEIRSLFTATEESRSGALGTMTTVDTISLNVTDIKDLYDIFFYAQVKETVADAGNVSLNVSGGGD